MKDETRDCGCVCWFLVHIVSNMGSIDGLCNHKVSILMSSGVLEIGVFQHFNTLGMGVIRIPLTQLHSLLDRQFVLNESTMYIEAIGRFQSDYLVSAEVLVSKNKARRPLMSSIICGICSDTQGYSVCTAPPTPNDPPL